MPVAEQVRRNRLMQERLRRYDVVRWADDFVQSLLSTQSTEAARRARALTGTPLAEPPLGRTLSSFPATLTLSGSWRHSMVDAGNSAPRCRQPRCGCKGSGKSGMTKTGKWNDTSLRALTLPNTATL